MKNTKLLLMALSSLIMLAAHAEQPCDDTALTYGSLNKEVEELAPRADIREVPLGSNYARAYFSDAERCFGKHL